MKSVVVQDFADWRARARHQLTSRTPPEGLQFVDAHEGQPSLFPELGPTRPPEVSGAKGPPVPRAFVKCARDVAPHRDPERWDVLYRVLWRLTHGAPRLLEDAIDRDVRRLRGMAKEVARDVHKMHALVRFRRVEADGLEHFIAWHRPDHRIVRRVADFFVDRFRGMRWTILTPDESMSWDGNELTFAEGVPRSAAPSSDELESLWKTYYRSTFNPARIKLAAMQAEMPKKHWATLPETEVITELLREAPERVQRMLDANRPTAAEFVPRGASLEEIATALRACRACDRCDRASGPVAGEGPPSARLVIVGEQPGDCEDRLARPFVGPAGQLLDRAMARAGIPRESAYLTNAVKSFGYKERGKRRIHQRPAPDEIHVCKPWVAAELRLIEPDVVVALGSSAAFALTGRTVAITRERGWLRSPFAARTFATVHPAAILRAPEATRAAAFDAFVDDLRSAAEPLRAVG